MAAMLPQGGRTPRQVRYDGDTFVTAEASGAGHQSFAFIGDDGHGPAKFIHNGRAPRRLG